MTQIPGQETITLIRLPAPVLEIWEREASVEKKTSMIESFLDGIRSLSLPVYFSAELSNDITIQLKSGLGELISGEPGFRHEVSILKELFANPDIVSAVYFDSINPLFDVSVFNNLKELHERYGADYSFIENVPFGVAPKIFGRTLFEAMEIKGDESGGDYDTDIGAAIPDELPMGLAEYIEKNINNFHVEVHFEAPDLRILRLDFSGKSRRSLFEVERAFDLLGGGNGCYQNLEGAISKEPGAVFTFPGYVEIEASSSCEYGCTFCARTFSKPGEAKYFKAAGAQKVVDFLESGFGDTGIALGGLGEPLENSEIVDIIKTFLNSEGVAAVLLETNAYYLDKIFSLVGVSGFDKLKLIVNLNSLKHYGKMHGVDDSFKDVVIDNLLKWKEQIVQADEGLLNNIYIQMLKIKENESEIDEIYNFSNGNGFSFLLQKYNSYNNRMEEKRVSDMTPLDRFFCWHLRRDLYIRSNGDVVFCKQDVEGEVVRGNLDAMSLSEIWKSQERDWSSNYGKDYSGFSKCAECDEYFTFNM